jgi:hypothetical protein
MSSHPYKHLEGRPEWKVLDRALSDLGKNGDLQELTPRPYLVGYLLKCLLDSAGARLDRYAENGKRNGVNGHRLRNGLARPPRRRKQAVKERVASSAS